jgi:hypothetical protein
MKDHRAARVLALTTAIVAVTAVLPAFAARQPAKRPPAAPPPVTISGRITSDSPAAFRASLGSGTRTVIVDSNGGDSLAAMEIGREIRNRNLNLVVHRACMAACAHFIFLAARERKVEPNSLVVFQSTATALARLVEHASSRDRSSAQKPLLPRKAAEEQFINELGIGAAILSEPQLRLQTSCYRLVRDRKGKATDIEYGRQYVGWTPTRDYLAQLGVRVNGTWPQTQDEFERISARVFAKGATPPLAFGGAAPMADADINAGYRAIKTCK